MQAPNARWTMGRIGRTYPRFDSANPDGDAGHGRKMPSPLTGAARHQLARDIAMTVIWVLGILAVLAWVLRLYR